MQLSVIDDQTLTIQLQREGKASFDKSWHTLMQRIVEKGRVNPKPMPAEKKNNECTHHSS